MGIIFAQIFLILMKNILSLLAIVLPALIIILGIAKLFLKKTSWANGLTMLFAILLLLIGLLRHFVFPDGGSSHRSGEKPKPLAVSKHGEEFNRSFESVLNNYYELTTAFTRNDAAYITNAAQNLKASLDSFRINDLKVDSIIYQTALQPYENAKAETASIIADPSMEEKKGSYNILSNEIFNLATTARYDLAKLYWLECEKAFGEDKPGNWLSKTEKAENPYGQKDCAELKVTLDNIPPPATDSTKNIADSSANR
jgi:hypothetical protein